MKCKAWFLGGLLCLALTALAACDSGDDDEGPAEASRCDEGEACWESEEFLSLPGRISDVAIAVDSTGAPHVLVVSGGELRYAARTPGGWYIEVVDRSGPFPPGQWAVAYEAALVIRPGDYPGACFLAQAIADPAAIRAAAAQRDDFGWSVAAGESAGVRISAALDGAGSLACAHDTETTSFGYLYQQGGTWTTELVPLVEGFGPGNGARLFLDGAGDSNVILLEPSMEEGTVALHWAVLGGEGWNFFAVDPEFGGDPLDKIAVATSDDGNPRVLAVRDPGDGAARELRHLWFDGLRWQWETLFSDVLDMREKALAVGVGEVTHALVPVRQDQSNLYGVRRDGVWIFEDVPDGEAGSVQAMALDAAGLPHVVSADRDGGAVLYLHRTGSLR